MHAGRFLALLFEQCEKLTTLCLANMPSLNWAHCKAAAAAWAAKPNLVKLTVRGVNLDGEFGVVLSRLPNLGAFKVWMLSWLLLCHSPRPFPSALRVNKTQHRFSSASTCWYAGQSQP